MPAKYDITIYQGQTFELSLVWKDGNNAPVDITNYTARMQIRRNARSTDVLHSLTTENGGIAVGGADGLVTLRIPAATSSAFTFKSGVYDLELVSPTASLIKRLMEGSVTVSPEVTR